MENKKIHIAIYRNGDFKVSAKKIETDSDKQVRVTMTPLVEMTKKQQEEALVFFEERMTVSLVDFEESGVMVLGDIVLKIAEVFIKRTRLSS